MTVKLMQTDYNFVDTALRSLYLYSVSLAKCGLHLPRIISILNKLRLLIVTATVRCYFSRA